MDSLFHCSCLVIEDDEILILYVGLRDTCKLKQNVNISIIRVEIEMALKCYR